MTQLMNEPSDGPQNGLWYENTTSFTCCVGVLVFGPVCAKLTPAITLRFADLTKSDIGVFRFQKLRRWKLWSAPEIPQYFLPIRVIPDARPCMVGASVGSDVRRHEPDASLYVARAMIMKGVHLTSSTRRYGRHLKTSISVQFWCSTLRTRMH